MCLQTDQFFLVLYSRNLDICDLVNATNDGPDQALKALSRRFQESDHRIIALSLVVLETCMKNCGTSFASAVQQPFMDELIQIGRGSKGDHHAEEALRLIQQWGRAYESKRSRFPLFFDTFMSLKTKGLRFPPEEEGVAAAFDVNKKPYVPAFI